MQMPTPGGLLKAGDRLEHPGMPNVLFQVTERTGNTKADYGVWIKRVDGKPMKGFRREYCRNGDHEYLMIEAHYHVFMTRQGWRLVLS